MRLNLFLHKSDTHTVLRRTLAALGPTWLASPARGNVKNKKLLERTAIHIEAGPGKEDRIAKGSYLALQRERAEKQAESRQSQGNDELGGDYLPDFLK